MEATEHLLRKRTLGQFFSPPAVAQMMASMFGRAPSTVRLLDAGAGAGSLTDAYVREMCQRNERPERIEVTAFEVDPTIIEQLSQTLDDCRVLCEHNGIGFSADVRNEDFIVTAASDLSGGLFGCPEFDFNAAIVNPPYRKIRSDSSERLALQSIGIEASNLYTAFLSLIVRLLQPESEIVAITPRSFCNGPYFRSFRRELLRSLTLKRLHIFESRSSAFREESVLQENVILHGVKCPPNRNPVMITSSPGGTGEISSRVEVPYSEVVSPTDPAQFIHLRVTDEDASAKSALSKLTSTLNSLGLSVSTGRVVDFRVREHLRPMPLGTDVPLIYPCHFQEGRIAWPKPESRKPNAIARTSQTENVLVPSECYVLTKRFSAKEERRRIVASVYDPSHFETDVVGFENHLNYFHTNGRGLPKNIAQGLFVFLNSTIVDLYFRQFNGHTQVNATDLRSLRYPSQEQLEQLGRRLLELNASQSEIDRVVAEVLRGEEK